MVSMDNVSPAADPLRGATTAADSGEVRLTLDEFLAAAGEQLGEEVSPRTVRLYATKGLIDRPTKDGRAAVYGKRHLLQLLVTRTLARRGLSLAAIGPMAGLDDSALEDQLRDLGPHTPQPGTALDSSTLSPSTQASPSREPNEAQAYLQSLRGTGDSGSAEAMSAKGLMPLLGSPLSHRTEKSPSSTSLSRSRSGSTRDASSRWHRFTLAPGIELHISDSVAVPPEGSRRMAWLNRLVARLVELLDSP